MIISLVIITIRKTYDWRAVRPAAVDCCSPVRLSSVYVHISPAESSRSNWWSASCIPHSGCTVRARAAPALRNVHSQPPLDSHQHRHYITLELFTVA